MIDEGELKQLIEQDVYDGYNEKAIFDRVCWKLQDSYKIKWNERLYDEVTDTIQKEDNNNNQLKRTMLMIREKMKKARSLLEQWKCPSKECHLTFLSQRYAIDASAKDEKKPSFYLVDMFLGRTRQLQFEDKMGSIKDHFDIVVLNDNHFLVSRFSDIYKRTSQNELKMHTFHLMELDRNNLTCKLLETKDFSHSILRVIKDANCENRFCILNHHDNAEYVQTCHLEQSKIKVDPNKMKINFDESVVEYRRSLQVRSDNMRCLITNEGEYNTVFILNMKIGGNQVSAQERIEIETDNGEFAYFIDTDYSYFTWSGEKLFIMTLDDSEYECVFAEIDVETRRLIRFRSKSSIDYFLFHDMEVFDGVLVLNCHPSSDSTKEHSNYRIPLNRPDKLTNIANEQFQRYILFMEEDQRDCLTKCLSTVFEQRFIC